MNRHTRAAWWRLADRVRPAVEPITVGMFSAALGVAVILYLTGA